MSGWKKYNIFGWIYTIVLLGGSFSNGLSQPANSVLSEGSWYRIGVTRTGVYKLTPAFLNRLGITVETLDPRMIRVFGNGGTALPQANAQPRPQDLIENAISVTGEADGRFDASDAVYFFAQSPHRIYYDSTLRDTAGPRFAHQLNPYSDTTYYFLNIGQQAGLRVLPSSFTAPTAPLITAFDDYFYQEKELTNRVQSGREWYGDNYNVTSQRQLSFNLPGRLPGAPTLLTAALMSQGNDTTRFRLNWGSQAVGTQTFNPVSTYQYDRKGIDSRQTYRLIPPSNDETISLTLTYDRGKATSTQGYINFLALQTQREIRTYGDQQLIRSLASAQLPAARYQVRQASADLLVWDVTNPSQPIQQSLTLSGTDGTFAAPGGLLRQFLLFTPAQAYDPERGLRISNQNLRAQPTPDLLIVTAAAWQAQAERLATLRREKDGLEVLIATTQQVYNEFASGQPDPTAIRDFARHLMNKTAGKLKYLLLFGDATYDYKGITGLLNATQLANTVPVYESRESLHPVRSYSSDDYFGFLKPEDGEWSEVVDSDHKLDIGVGRLPLKSVEEAQNMVNKLIRYASTKTQHGDWRTKITFVADDGDGNIHQRDADFLAEQIIRTRPPFRTEKIYLDSYPQTASQTGDKAPQVNQAINRSLNEGRLIINYSGHGGEAGWAQEQIVTLEDILGWRNSIYPLFVTATCEFGRYDDPAKVSGAELALLNAQGGAIGLLTTTRPVYANTNYILNQAFYGALADQTAQSTPVRLGDLVRITKNNSLAGSLNRNFTLLGDPSMALAYPQAEITLTRLNGLRLNATNDTLKALSSVTLEGEVRQQGQRLTDFDGTIQLTIFAKPDTVKTLGTEKDSPIMSYQIYQRKLFDGKVSVRAGRFIGEFRMPNLTGQAPGLGKLVAYAVRADSLFDATGSYGKLFIDPRNANSVADTKPPVIQLFINDTTFREGQSVIGPRVRLIARLKDESGINIAGLNTNNALTLWLNDETPVIVNNYFSADVDNYRSGTINYLFNDLQQGTYTVRLKAFDLYNNPAEAALKFIVSDKPGLIIETVTAFPNPVSDQATFQIKHNRLGEKLEATLTIVDIKGRIIAKEQATCTECQTVWSDLVWNAQSSASLVNGIYFYTIILKSASDGSVTKTSGKLIYAR
ncbi:type IX secretion system sortase PorU [Tellurirhabdus bombi]|uniref:type IX secretion system sortase PorU n=1 Tax=Tellurirhabdus bombi TaxID=2907205 RepID=UPI001F1B9E58|nr:type IX secretion system sortase PorU [Tellurirhabdus bombi]